MLLDFGVAKLLDLGHEQLTLTGTTVGTPASMAPEQAGGGQIDERTDVYGLGAMLFHMLTGTKPFPGHETNELRFLHQHARRPRPSTRAKVPPVFDAIVSKAMAIDPDARYQTPLALVEAFEQVAAAASAPGASGAAPAPVREGAPLYLLAEIATIDDSLASPSEELWDDLEAVRAALRELSRPPYVVRVSTDTSLLVEQPIAQGTIERVTEACRAIAARLRARPGRHPAVRVGVRRQRLAARSANAPPAPRNSRFVLRIPHPAAGSGTLFDHPGSVVGKRPKGPPPVQFGKGTV